MTSAQQDANILANKSSIQNQDDTLQSLMDNTKTPSELDSASRLALLDAIYPRIVNSGKTWRTDKGTNTDYSTFEIGDVIRQIDATNGVSYVGRVLNATLTLPDDFNDSSKIQKFNEDYPAL